MIDIKLDHTKYNNLRRKIYIAREAEKARREFPFSMTGKSNYFRLV